MQTQQAITHATESATLADVLERILDKGIVIAGDIKIKLVDIELLTIQIRLLIASVDKAKEMGMDWWTTNPDLVSSANTDEIETLKMRIQELEIASRNEEPEQRAANTCKDQSMPDTEFFSGKGENMDKIDLETEEALKTSKTTLEGIKDRFRDIIKGS